jgi:hypothetical protein
MVGSTLFQMSAHLGGSKASAVYASIYLELNRCFLQHVSGVYSEEVTVFGFMLCVSGNIRDFGGDGIERLKRSKRQKSIDVDIVIPQHRWSDATPRERAEHLAQQVRDGVELMLKRLARDKVVVDLALLRGDLERALEAFVGHY